MSHSNFNPGPEIQTTFSTEEHNSREYAKKILDLTTQAHENLYLHQFDKNLADIITYYYNPTQLHIYDFQYRANYTDISPTEQKYFIKNLEILQALDPDMSIENSLPAFCKDVLSHNQINNWSDIEQKHSEAHIITNLLQVKNSLDKYSLSLGLPIDTIINVYSTPEIEYDLKGVSSVGGENLAFVILEINSQLRYLELGLFDENPKEYTRTDFYQTLSTEEDFTNLILEFKAIEERKLLNQNTQIRSSTVQTKSTLKL